MTETYRTRVKFSSYLCITVTSHANRLYSLTMLPKHQYRYTKLSFPVHTLQDYIITIVILQVTSLCFNGPLALTSYNDKQVFPP